MAVALLVKLLNRAGYYWRIFFSTWCSDWRGVGQFAGRHNTKAGFTPGFSILRRHWYHNRNGLYYQPFYRPGLE